MEKTENELFNLFDTLYVDGENVIKTFEKITKDENNKELSEELENFKSTQKELEDYLTFLKQKYNK